MIRSLFFVLALFSLLLFGCAEKPAQTVELMKFSADNLDGVIDQTVSFDQAVSSDGTGSLKVTASAPETVRLYETGDLDIENCRLLYQAKIRTENLTGKAYLEMWCVFDSLGEYFGRDLATPVTRADNWSPEEIFFMLQKGQNPNNVKLNLVIDGTGTVWIDDIRLVKAPLN